RRGRHGSRRHRARASRGNLVRLAPVLHRSEDLRGHRRPRREVPAQVRWRLLQAQQEEVIHFANSCPTSAQQNLAEDIRTSPNQPSRPRPARPLVCADRYFSPELRFVKTFADAFLLNELHFCTTAPATAARQQCSKRG